MGRPSSCNPCCGITCAECVGDTFASTMFGTIVDAGGLFPCACAHGQVVTFTYGSTGLWGAVNQWHGTKTIGTTFFEFSMACTNLPGGGAVIFKLLYRIAATGTCFRNGLISSTTRSSLTCSPFAATFDSGIAGGGNCDHFRINMTE